MQQNRSNLLLAIVVGGAAFLFFILCLLVLAILFGYQGTSPLHLGSDRIVSLELDGIISDSKEFVDQLKDFGNRPGVRAVVIRINSPGGGVAASQEIFEAVRKFRLETHKKVVVSMAGVAASGAYYVACAADKIFANPGTLTGSIGVIAEWYNYGELLKWAKMQNIVIKSGVFKDSGSPTRPLTDEERAYFQSLIDNLYAQFVSTVADCRHMNEEQVRKLADGRVFTGEQAKHEGLVDEIGSYHDALAAAAKMAGITGPPRVISPPKKRVSILDLILGDSQSILPSGWDRSESHIRFEYLWR